MIEHDQQLYDKALKLGFEYMEFERLESLCVTEEGAKAIRKLLIKRYHQEEAMAGLL